MLKENFPSRATASALQLASYPHALWGVPDLPKGSPKFHREIGDRVPKNRGSPKFYDTGHLARDTLR
jgi:hypothetical protein